MRTAFTHLYMKGIKIQFRHLFSIALLLDERQLRTFCGAGASWAPALLY